MLFDNRVGVEHAAAVGADVDPSENARVAADAAEARAVLVLVVVDADPASAGMVGSPDCFDSGRRGDGKQRWIIRARRRFAEAEQLDVKIRFWLLERFSFVSRVEKPGIADEPQIAGLSRRRQQWPWRFAPGWTKRFELGGQIQAGGGATDIVQLADTQDMCAEVDINEAEIAEVAIGSPATVVPDDYPDRRFNASLVKIYPAADRQKGTVKIEVHIDKPDLQITKPEMSVKVSFLDGQPAAGNEPQLIIPKDSVRGDGGETYVWAVRGGLARRVPIVRGRDVESGVEVKQGLKGGDILRASAIREPQRWP